MLIRRALPLLSGLLLALAAGCATRVPADPPERLLAEGKARAEEKKWTQARRYFEAVRDRHPASPAAEEAMFLVAETRRSAGQHDAAFSAYKAFVERYPNSRFAVQVADGEYELGMAHLEGRTAGFLFFGPDRSQGVPVLEHMQINFKNHSRADDALVRTGDFHLNDGSYAEAARSYRELLAEYPRSEFRLGAQRALAIALWRQSQGAAYDERLMHHALRAFRDYLDAAKPAEEGGEAEKKRVEEAVRAAAAIRERLAEKQLLVARLYERRSRPRSAAIYYRYCVREFGDTASAKEAAKRLERLGAAAG